METQIKLNYVYFDFVKLLPIILCLLGYYPVSSQFTCSTSIGG